MRIEGKQGKQRSARHPERGVAAVEFALIITLFLGLVMGAIDWGWFFFVHQRVVNAAREGARAGTLLPPPPDTSEADGRSEAVDAAEDYLQRVLLERQGVVATTETINGIPALRVTINYAFTPLTGFWNGVLPAQAQATAVMRWQ